MIDEHESTTERSIGKISEEKTFDNQEIPYIVENQDVQKDRKILRVILDDGSLVYIKGLSKDIGKRIIVRLQNKKSIGIVLDEIEKTERLNSRVKEKICENFYFPDGDFRLLTPELIKLCYKIKEKYFCGLGDAIKLVCPPEFLKLSVVLLVKDEEIFRKLRAKSLFQILLKRKKIALRKAKKICKSEKLLHLENEGLIKIVPERSVISEEDLRKEFRRLIGQEEKSTRLSRNLELTKDQRSALEKIIESDQKKFLIHGATGSGKTEIYLQAIEKMGGGAIFLLPEISLTTFLLSRIKERFPNIAVLHSGITNKQRIIYWFALRYGITNIVVGARSAVFSPVNNLKLIVIDEEHDQSYKQTPESGSVFYDAREVAFMRSEIENAKVVMGSATPSVETYYRAKNEKNEIELIEIKKRIPGMVFPAIKVVDLRDSKKDDFLSFPLSYELRDEIDKRIQNRQNVILLFTRRGWALYVMCSACGYKFKCSRCDSALVYHKKEGLVCHWCGRKYKTPAVCHMCSSENLEVIGFGTERIEEELKSIFNVQVFRMDSDVVKSEKHARAILEKFARTNPAILVGTQMVSKGFDFPSVTLVGVILADTEFMLPDFRADERAFSLFVQVAGRSGRKIKNPEDQDWADYENQSISIIQTYSPDHPVIKYAVDGNYENFFEEEIEKRKSFNLPPFSKIGVLSFCGVNEQRCWEIARSFDERLKELNIEHENPTKSVRYFVEGTYNVKIIMYLKPEDSEKLKKVFRTSKFFLQGVKIVLDISPQSIL